MHEEQLEPPGSLAILGAGPVGLEAALYARSLGYEVHVFEAGEVGQTLRDKPTEFLPAPFGRWSSPLGITALRTQEPLRELPHPEMPLTYRDFLHEYLLPLAATDLISDNLKTHCRVLRLESEPLEGMADGEEVPADFRVVAEFEGETKHWSVEAVLDTSGSHGVLEYPPAVYDPSRSPLADMATGVPYLYRLGARSQSNQGYLGALEQIRRLFAMLYGRPAIDLYSTARF